MLTIKINAVDKTSSIEWSTFEIRKGLTKEPSSLFFTLKVHSGKPYIPNLGEEVEIFDEATKIFGGYVVEAERKIDGKVKRYEIICKDYQYALDRRLVSKIYSADYAGNTVKSIISDFTTGFTTTNVETGVTVDKITFNYSAISKAIQDLADRVGFDWYVDQNKDIHFFNPEGQFAPFELNDEGGNFYWNSIQFNTNINNIKNFVTVRGGMEALGAITDKRKGDGQRRIFDIGYEYTNFTVKKDNVVQTLGKDGVDDSETVDVLYNPSNHTIIFREDNKPADGIIVEWSGNAVRPVIVADGNYNSIAAYGRFDFMFIDKSITTTTEARQRVQVELKKFEADTNELVFITNKNGLKVGQRIRLNSNYWGIDKWFTIKRILLKVRDPNAAEKEYIVNCSGSEVIGIVDILSKLLVDNQIKQIVVNQYEVVNRYMTLSDIFKMADVAPVFKDRETGPWYVADSNIPVGKVGFCQVIN